MQISVEMVSLLQQGNEAARRDFWQTAFAPVLGICSRVAGPGPLAVDITTDLLNDFLFRYVVSLSNPLGAWAYLKMMAVRRSIREKQRSIRHEMFEEHRMRLGETHDGNEDVAGMIPLLNDCLGTLTPKAQSAIRLKYRQGLSNSEIGNTVGGSKQYIGRLLKQSLRVLRDCLQKKVANHG
ncbi:MAG: sigma-70 family RNA polymerase sigma factor [Deltaproteobacteria bacterium]|nr:sigma-70 family RNA polymerase sigma factor [Deltaproteobacteria bacterium]